MKELNWVKEFPGPVTICDTEGIILEMNDQAEKLFEDEGGRKLIGSNMLDCHPDSAREKIEEMLETKVANIYTAEENGVKTLFYQSPWYKDGEFAGIVELELEIPFEMPHIVRT